MFGSRLLSGLNLRRRFRSSQRRSRRQTSFRPDVALESSRLEDRALMTKFNAFGYIWSNDYRNNLTGTGWYSSDQQWAPQNAGALNNHLFLKLSKENVDGHTAMSSGELTLVGKVGHTKSWHPSYGTYLVVAHTSGGFSKLDSHGINNVNFGVFTYEDLKGIGTFEGRKITGLSKSLVAKLKPGDIVTTIDSNGKPLVPTYGIPQWTTVSTRIVSIDGDTVLIDQDPINNPGSSDHVIHFTDTSLRNSHRELDLAEVGRFNNQNTQPKPGPTNAQFTLQPAFDLYTPNDNGILYGNYPNIHRFTLPENPRYITLVMQWDGPNSPVKFRQYSGLYTLRTYSRAFPDNIWTTAPDQNPFIPNNGHQTLHLNLWRSGSPQAFDGVNPNLEVDIVHFQYKPKV